MRGIGFILVLLCATSSFAFVDGNTCTNLFDPKNEFNSNIDYLKKLSSKEPNIPATENSNYQLVKAIIAIYENYSVATPLDIPIRYRPLYTLKMAVSTALIKIGMDSNFAHEFANRSIKDSAEALGFSWKETQRVLKIQLDAKKFRAAHIQLGQLVEVDSTFDISYFAGYSKNNPRKIYVDRSFNHPRYLKYIYLHEAVEKALLDELKLPAGQAYLSTHQLAQRIEKAAVLNDGDSWAYYQHKLMAYYIALAEAPNRKFYRVPNDLDETPYLELKDHDVIAKMRRAMRPTPSKPGKIFSTQELAPGIHFLLFEDRIQLAKVMMRFQEHFESPEFRGKIFSRSEFRQWYKSQNGGKFDYFDFWGDGFNFPSHILEAFYKGEFKNITAEERQVLETFKDRRHEKFYVIATSKNSETKTFEHEVAHALFYLNAAYRNEILNILSLVDIQPVKDFLRSEYGDYHKAVLLDEAHAWLMHNSEDLKQDGFDVTPYKPTIELLQNAYKKFSNGAAPQ